MQSNTDDNLYKEFENAGWSKMRQQLDIELPQKKKKDRGLIWFLFFGLVAIGGYQYFSYPGNLNQIIKTGPELKEINDIELPTINQNSKTLEQEPVIIPDKNITKNDHILSSSESLNESTSIKSSGENGNQTLAFTDSKSVQAKSDLNDIPVKRNITNAAKKSMSSVSSDKKDILTDVVNPITDLKKSEIPLLHEGQTSLANQNKSQLSDELINEKDVYNRVEHNISLLTRPISVLSYKDRRYANTYLTLNKKGIEASISPILVSNEKILKTYSGFFIETSLDYFTKNTVKNPDYFASSGNLGYRQKISNRLYIAGQGGIVYPYSNSKFFFDNQGLANASPSNSTVFDANKSSSTNADPVITISGVALASNRTVTSINNGTLYLSNTDQAKINNNNGIQYNFKVSMGYQISNRIFIESGLDLRDEFKNNPVLISVSSQFNQLATANQNKITNYQLPQTNPASQLAVFGLIGFKLGNRWDILGKIMTPSFKSGKGIFFDTQSFIPQSGVVQLLTNKQSVNTTGFSLAVRFRF